MIVFTFRTQLRRLSSSRFLWSEVEDLLHIVVGPCGGHRFFECVCAGLCCRKRLDGTTKLEWDPRADGVKLAFMKWGFASHQEWEDCYKSVSLFQFRISSCYPFLVLPPICWQLYAKQNTIYRTKYNLVKMSSEQTLLNREFYQQPNTCFSSCGSRSPLLARLQTSLHHSSCNKRSTLSSVGESFMR